MMTFQEQAKEAIRTSGGRITSQRELLLDVLAHVEGDIDAEALHQQASEHDPNLSLPTVYRTLHTLEAAHIIQSRYVSRDHERKVYRIHKHEDTFHFTCRRCGRLIPYQSELVTRLKQELSTTIGGDVLTLCMCASGLCADCREEEQG